MEVTIDNDIIAMSTSNKYGMDNINNPLSLLTRSDVSISSRLY